VSLNEEEIKYSVEFSKPSEISVGFDKDKMEVTVD